MAKLFGLTAEQQQRLARVADKVERQPIQRANQQSGTSKPSPSFWVELTEEDPANPGRYAWKLVDYVDHEWTDLDPEIASPEGEYTAIEANLGSGMVGQRVELHFYGYDAEGKPRYLFGQTALPFMAMIWDQGPEGEADYTIEQQRYWAIPIAIRQPPPPTPPATKDSNWGRVESIGEPFTLVNLAERRVTINQSPATTNNIQRNIAPRKMLWRGHICRVWTEIDDQGVPRRVCSEYPELAVWVRVIGPATGDFAGIRGCYDGSQAAPLVAPLEVPAAGVPNIGQLGIPTPASSTTTTNVLVVNLAELGGNDRGLAIGDKTATGRDLHMIGHRWGWTDEEAPRQVIVVDAAACNPVTMTATQTASNSYGNNERDMINALKDDVAAIIKALQDAQMMRT